VGGNGGPPGGGEACFKKRGRFLTKDGEGTKNPSQKYGKFEVTRKIVRF